MKTVFFTLVDDNYYYQAGCHVMVNSFKKFHPDIDLVVFRQDVIDRMFKEHEGLNFYNAKPTFAKLLTDKYDKVINIDCDTVITHRLDPILEDNWEVGSVSNFNLFENASLENVTERMYVQAGLVGSTNKRFWDIWETANHDAMKYLRKENDVLNLVWYNDPEVSAMKRTLFDEDKGYMGCKALGVEGRFYVKGDEIWCDNELVYAYHHAKGGDFPKLKFERLPFSWEVIQKLNEFGYNGQSTLIKGIE